MSPADRSAFPTRIAAALYGGRMTAAQREGAGFLLGRVAAQDLEPAQAAYVLATAHHETDGTMQPIRERGGGAYLTRLYDIAGKDPARARAHGNTQAGDGIRYAGRGYVQLTWKGTYARIGLLLGIDLVATPDRALDPETAATILIRGMMEGWFTGRSLPEFVGGTRRDFVQARRVVNGLDRAKTIAAEAELMLAAIAPVSSRPLSPKAPRRLPAAAASRPPAHP